MNRRRPLEPPRLRCALKPIASMQEARGAHQRYPIPRQCRPISQLYRHLYYELL